MHRGSPRWLPLLATLTLLVGAGACNSSASPTSEATDGAAGAVATESQGAASQVPLDTYVSASIGEPESLDPSWTYETSGAGIESNIYEGVVAFNREAPDDFVPALATDWSLSDDKLTYTFNIRDGVTFHEGGTLTPTDIAYSVHRALLQDRGDGPMGLFLEPMLGTASITSYAFEKAGLEQGEEQTVADVPAEAQTATCEDVLATAVADDAAGTVTMHVKAPTPWFLQLLSQPWVAALDKEWMTEQGDWDGECATWVAHHNPAAEESTLFDKANGTGPYMLSKWEKGVEVVMAANENYWRTEPAWDGGPSGPAALKTIRLTKVDEWGARLAKLQAREVDTVLVPRANIDQVEDFVKEEYAEGATTGTEKSPSGFLKLYSGFPTVSATAATFNFETSTEGGNEFIGSGALDGQGIPPDFFSDEHVRKGFNYCFDWDTFINDALMGEGFQTRGPVIEGLQGYTEDNEIYSFDPEKCADELSQAWDGKLAETGFKMSVAYNEGNLERETVARILAENLASVNEKYVIDVVSLEWPSFLDARRQGKLPVSVTGWLEDYHDASNWVKPFMESTGAYARAQHFPDEMQATYDDLYAQGLAETDEALRGEIYAQMQDLANKDAINIWLYQATGRFYVNDQVEGWYNNLLAPGNYYYPMSKTAE